MLKNAWNKVADIGVREYIEGARYIKMDGTPYHSKGVAAFMHRPEVKVGLLTMLFNVSTAMLSQGTLNPFDPAVMSLGMFSAYFLFSGVGVSRFIDYLSKDAFPVLGKGKVIDTEGRDLSQAAPSLRERFDLESVKRDGFEISCAGAGAAILVGALLGFPGGLAGVAFVMTHIALPFTAPMIISGVSQAVRAHKLLTGEYVFCDKPPAKRQDAKQVTSDEVKNGATTITEVPAP